MKKLISFLAIVLFLTIPIAANASLLGYGDLNVSHSTPTGGNYYLDYDGTVVSSNFGYTTGLEEVFCVSPQEGSDGNYNFYTITSDLDTLFSSAGLFAKLSMAAWVADNWGTFLGSSSDTNKGEAQKAVWKLTNVMDITDGSGADWDLYAAALDHSGYVTNSWLYAYSPINQNDHDYQDFLTPVPEPATMLLLGFGLFGLAGISRKFKK